MLNVIKNEIAKNFIANPTNYVGVIKTKNGNFIKALGNDKNEVKEEIYCEWAVIWNYEGTYEVLEATEINIEEN